jgi:hypothetical protein
VNNMPNRAPVSSAIAQLGRVFAVGHGEMRTGEGLPPAPSHHPQFLPDFATLTPDQAQEMRYGRGRSSGKGSDR